MNFRKIHSLFFVIFFSLLGCSKESDPVLEDPDSRLNKYLSERLETLTDAPYGFKANLSTSLEKSFSLYIQFDKNGRVSMLSDFDDRSAVELQTSSYRLKALQRPSLLFDTYNYLTIFADPQGSVNGGVNGQGLKGDNDFGFVLDNADTVLLTGNKNGAILHLAKATAEEQKAFLAGGLGQARQQLASFLKANSNLYLYVQEQKIALAVDTRNRMLTLSKLEADGSTISSTSSAFNYTVNGVEAVALKLGADFVEKITWDNTKKAYMAQVGEKLLEVMVSSTPVFPLYLQFGFNKTYKVIGTTTNSLPAGVNSSFNQLWTTLNSNFTGTNRVIRSMEFKLISDTQATLSINYSSGTSNYVADMSFTYAINQSLMTLSNPKRDYSNSNWTARILQLKVLEDYILKGPFVLDWVSSSSAAVTSPLGGLQPQDNAQAFLYGFLK